MDNEHDPIAALLVLTWMGGVVVVLGILGWAGAL